MGSPTGVEDSSSSYRKASDGRLYPEQSGVKGLGGRHKNESKRLPPGILLNRCFLQRPTRVQKMHWHWVMVVICSSGYSPRQSLHDTSGSRARSHVGRYRAVVMAEQSEMREA